MYKSEANVDQMENVVEFEVDIEYDTRFRDALRRNNMAHRRRYTGKLVECG